jgi:fructose-1,6-bisphosphatase/inositol monophosphatase family enzyme
MVEADLNARSAITAPHVRRRIRLCAVMSRTTSVGDRDDLAFAQLLADAADRISLDLYQRAELLVVTKPDRSEVSEADLAVEAALRRLLHTHRPEQVVDVAVRHDSDRTCDLAVPMLLVTEAGRILTDPAGQPGTEGQLAVTRKRLLHPAVLAAISKPGGRDPPPCRDPDG